MHLLSNSYAFSQLKPAKTQIFFLLEAGKHPVDKGTSHVLRLSEGRKKIPLMQSAGLLHGHNQQKQTPGCQ